MYPKNKIIALVLLVLILVGGFLLFRGGDSEDRESNEPAKSAELRGGEIKVSGTISCLPYKSTGGDQTCVKALKGDDGKVYALNTINSKGSEANMEQGTKVTAVGVFEAANTSVDDSSVFSYDGVLVVRLLEKR